MNRQRAIDRVARLEGAIRTAAKAGAFEYVILNDDGDFQCVDPSDLLPDDDVIVKPVSDA